MLKKVTFTGIDARTKAAELIALYREFPFIEFGFLVSDSLTGKNRNPRYPAQVILKAYKKAKLPMALHLCGKVAMDVVKKDDWGTVYRMMGEYMPLFDRIQINAAQARHILPSITLPEGKQIILQTHDGNDTMWEQYGSMPNVTAFQDNSGGTGKFENTWRAPLGEFFGYGGGLSPENVVEAVRGIQEVCPTDFWIDMESGVRTNDWFDVKKCREVCEQLVRAGLIG